MVSTKAESICVFVARICSLPHVLTLNFHVLLYINPLALHCTKKIFKWFAVLLQFQKSHKATALKCGICKK